MVPDWIQLGTCKSVCSQVFAVHCETSCVTFCFSTLTLLCKNIKWRITINTVINGKKSIIKNLQCFDIHGWASRSVFDLWKIKWWGACVVLCLEQGANDFHVVQLMPLVSIISAFIETEMILSGASQRRLSWKRATLCC